MKNNKGLNCFLLISVLLHITVILSAFILYKSGYKQPRLLPFEVGFIKINHESINKGQTVNSDETIIKNNISNRQISRGAIVSRKIQNDDDKKLNNIITKQTTKSNLQNNSVIIKDENSELDINTVSNNHTLAEVAYPDYRLNPKPVYPKMARRKGHEGTVMLKVNVLENGNVGQVNLEKSSNFNLLDNSAIDAVNEWIFIPGSKNGVPISSWVIIPIKFRLKNI